MTSALSVVEKNVLGALLMLANDRMIAHASNTAIADAMGYKRPGGIITYALKTLEMRNFIATLSKGTYKVMV